MTRLLLGLCGAVAVCGLAVASADAAKIVKKKEKVEYLRAAGSEPQPAVKSGGKKPPVRRR